MNILYLTGAGASCQALPLVSDFTPRLGYFKAQLRNIAPPDTYGHPSAQFLKGAEKELFDAIGWLITNAKKHASVDTFAKKLFFLRESGDLKKLKAVLSTFLVFEQARQNVDMRYDSFLASVLSVDSSQKIIIPENIKILTWNYDTQWEKAFFGFCGDKERVVKYITQGDRLSRLNGFCGIEPSMHLGNAFHAVWEANEDEALRHAIELYKKYMVDGASEPYIRFAWEGTTQALFDEIKIDWQNIDVLIVIGYSFPYFNREIDQVILKSISNLSKVYLQYPEGFHDSIEERMASSGLQVKEIIRISATDLFCIPNEL